MDLEDETGKPLDLIKRIAAGEYTSFGMRLLQDENGVSVELIKRDHSGAEEVTRAILQQWLTIGGPNCTYSHLIYSLRAAKFGCLADEVAKINAKEPITGER